MRLAIVGTRQPTSILKIPKSIRNSGFAPTEIISGGASGVDTAAAKWAYLVGMSITEILPDYKSVSFLSPPIVRNRKILDSCDAVLALWNGYSSGTRWMVHRAVAEGIKLYVVAV